MNGVHYLNKHKYIVVKSGDNKYIIGKCLVNHDQKYTPIAYANNDVSAKLVMNALVEYEIQHKE